MLPTIATGNVGSALAGEYEVANSLRFDDGSSDYLNRTPSSAGNRRTWTFSAWVKKCMPLTGGNQRLIACGSGTGGLFSSIEYDSSDRIRILEGTEGGSSSVTVRGAGFNRDPSAWQHVVVKYDSTQGTAADRIEIYLNGVEVTYDSTTYPSSNKDSEFNNNVVHTIGATSVGSSVGSFFDGYMAEVVLIDGQALDPTSFGEFDEDSPTIWKPKDVSGLTFGTNGFYLDFENASNLGADVSGNSNNFTVNNLTSVDQSTDTCTNNFATLNPLTNTRGTSQNFKEGNLQIDGTGSGAGASASTISTSTSGKYYIECKIDSLGSGYAEFFAIATSSYANHTLGYFETNTDTILWNLDYRSGQSKIRKDGSSIITTPTSFSNGDIIGMAIDVDNGKIYFHRNGTYVNYSGTQNPSSGSNGITLPTSSDGYLIAASVDNNSGSGTTLTMNFGSPSFSISSGNSDGNGYGNFEYSVPSGYYSLCTKNLAEFG